MGPLAVSTTVKATARAEVPGAAAVVDAGVQVVSRLGYNLPEAGQTDKTKGIKVPAYKSA